MGAINYFTSDYITLGVRPYNANDLLEDSMFMEEMQALCEEYGTSIQDELCDYIRGCYSDDMENINTELDKHNFCYYSINIEPGYYEGFSLIIENNFPIAFDCWEDRRAANKEITEIRHFLEECAGMGLVKCCPGWCTSYSDYAGTMEAIKAAVAEMRAVLKTIPTWRQYSKGA